MKIIGFDEKDSWGSIKSWNAIEEATLDVGSIVEGHSNSINISKLEDIPIILGAFDRTKNSIDESLLKLIKWATNPSEEDLYKNRVHLGFDMYLCISPSGRIWIGMDDGLHYTTAQRFLEVVVPLGVKCQCNGYEMKYVADYDCEGV